MPEKANRSARIASPSDLRERVRMLCLDEFEKRWNLSWSRFAEGLTGGQSSGTHFEKTAQAEQRLAVELAQDFKRWAERLWAFEHVWDPKPPPMGRFDAEDPALLSASGSVAASPDSPARRRMNRLRRLRKKAGAEPPDPFFWTVWVTKNGAAVNAILDLRAAQPSETMSRRVLLVVHLWNCHGCGFRGNRLKDRELAVISILDGNWPKGRQAPPGGFTPYEIIRAESDAMKMIRRRIEARNRPR